MSSRLFLSVREERGLAYDVSSGLVDYADAGALEVSAGVDPAGLGEALDAILAELARLRDELVPADELAKAKRYLSGGLELRMDDTRHVASWIGGQEALHDRVLTLDEALAAVDAVDAAAVQRVAAELFRDDGLRLAAVAPARHLRGLDARLRLPAMTEADDRPATPAVAAVDAPSRGADLVLAGLHLRMGSLVARPGRARDAGRQRRPRRAGCRRPRRGALADRRPRRRRRRRRPAPRRRP